MSPVSGASTSLQLTAATTAAAGAVHLAAAVAHFRDDTLLGVGFVVVGVLQLLLSATALVRPGGQRRWFVSGFVALNATALAVWALSRTVGLPIGHPGPEPAALPDLVTAAFELIALGAVAWWAIGGRRRAWSRRLVAGVVAAWSLSSLGAGAAVASLATTGHAHGATVAADEHHGQDAEAVPAEAVPAEAVPAHDDPTRDPVSEPPPTPAEAGDGHTHAPGEEH